jgi:DNA topoisomerase-2
LHFANAEIVNKYMSVESNGFTKFENDFKLHTTKGLGTKNMYLFNEKGAITKYDSAFDIINQFYDVRLEFYRKRKEFILNKLQHDADVMSNKIRFIKDVIAEKLYVHKMRKINLEEYLETNQYMKHEDNYDYITRIPVYNLTIDKVEDLEAEIVKALDCIKKLSDMTIEAIWLEELNEFEKIYAKFLEENVEKPASKNKKK